MPILGYMTPETVVHFKCRCMPRRFEVRGTVSKYLLETAGAHHARTMCPLYRPITGA